MCSPTITFSTSFLLNVSSNHYLLHLLPSQCVVQSLPSPPPYSFSTSPFITFSTSLPPSLPRRRDTRPNATTAQHDDICTRTARMSASALRLFVSLSSRVYPRALSLNPAVQEPGSGVHALGGQSSRRKRSRDDSSRAGLRIAVKGLLVIPLFVPAFPNSYEANNHKQGIIIGLITAMSTVMLAPIGLIVTILMRQHHQPACLLLANVSSSGF